MKPRTEGMTPRLQFGGSVFGGSLTESSPFARDGPLPRRRIALNVGERRQRRNTPRGARLRANAEAMVAFAKESAPGVAGRKR
jgi:hypothetical protein